MGRQNKPATKPIIWVVGMEVTAILLARVVQLITIKEPLYVPDVVSELVERYGFVRIPTSPDEMLAADRPLVFEHGRLGGHSHRRIVIQKLELYRQAAIVETVTSTDDSERVTDDFLEWTKEMLPNGMIVPNRRMYVSQLEIRLDTSLAHPFGFLADFAQRLTRTLTTYEETPTPMFSLNSLGFATDPAKLPLASDFRVERRIGLPYADNAYFSQAPLKTEDHKSELRALEMALTGADHPLQRF